VGGEGAEEEDSGGDLSNVWYKPICNCHDDFPLNNEYILIKTQTFLYITKMYKINLGKLCYSQYPMKN
jgi:hypothetical protein